MAGTNKRNVEFMESRDDINRLIRTMTRVSIENTYDKDSINLPEDFDTKVDNDIDEVDLGYKERHISDEIRQNAAYKLFTNGGFLTPKHRVTIQNALSLSDLARFIPETIITIVREALEPDTHITDMLFQKMTTNMGMTINIGTVGAMTAGLVAEGTEGKTVTLAMGDGEQVAVHIKKHGINIAVTEEVITYSQWDVLGVWLRAAGRAMARHKEAQAIDQLNYYGQLLFDNETPANAVYKSLTGRNIAGALNGSFTVNDLMKMYGHLRMLEFVPDTMITHPLAWAMWATDPELREIVFAGSRVASEAGMPTQGRGAMGWADPFGGRGLRTKTTGRNTPGGLFGKIGIDPYSSDFTGLGSTWTIPPRYLPSPVTVIVSPYLAYNATGGKSGTGAAGYPTSSVIMADSNDTGVIVYPTEAAGVYLEEWDDPARAIKNIAVRERYAMQILNQGKAIGVANKCVIAKNYVFDNVNSATLAAIDPSGSGLAD